MIALALYKKTPLCGLWKTEKRIYSRLPSALQYPVLALYSAANLARISLRGKNPLSHIAEYKAQTGNEFLA